MFKFFGLIILAIVLYRAWKKEESAEKHNPFIPHEAITRCDYCGIYFPVSKAIRSGQHVYCCEQHHQADV